VRSLVVWEHKGWAKGHKGREGRGNVVVFGQLPTWPF